MRLFLSAAALLLMALASTAAKAQTVLQGGPWTPGHASMYSSSGLSQPIVTDSGTAGGGALGKNLSEIGIVARDPNNVYPSVNSGNGPFFTHACVYDAPTTNATGYHFLCLDPNAQGGGLVAYGAGGAATALPLYFNINGQKFQFQSVLNPATPNLLSAGCIADGVTDQTACINNVLTTATGCVVVPATQFGFYVAGTITVSKCLEGDVFTANTGHGSYVGSSWIKCNNQSAHTCVVGYTTNSSNSMQIHDISLVGSGATPVSGAIAFQWTTGYNLILTNFQTVNFDTCAYFGPTVGSGLGPLSAHMTNTFFSECKTHYVVDDGIPELYFLGGRWGENGGFDYDSADDMIYATKTTDSGPGGGPNTINIVGLQANPGGRAVGCTLRWGGFAFTTGAFGANKISNSHFEVASGSGYTGAASRGMLCIDSTLPHFPSLTVVNSDMTEDGTKSMPFFNIDPSVPFDGPLSFLQSLMCSAPSTLSLQGMTGTHTATFDGNYICSGQTFTAGDTTAALTLSNNTLGNYAVTGKWLHLTLNNNFGTMTDTATGNVFESAQVTRPWTPTITMGGTPVAAYTAFGTVTRTPNGGYSAYFNIAITSKGGGTGAVVIGNLPYACNSAAGSSPLNVAQNLTGLTGALNLQTGLGIGLNTISYITQSTATGVITILDTNITNTTNFQGIITCGQAQ